MYHPVFPLKVSNNGRYFIDAENRPFFWLGTTQWQIFREYSLEEARIILENIKEKGFSVVQTMLLGVGEPVHPNIYGETPWVNNNPLTPNETYFDNVDSVVEIAQKNGLVISMAIYHQRFGDYMLCNRARKWAKWVAQRYKEIPNIIWCMHPRANQEFVPILRELAAGLQEGDGGLHMIYVHPDPSPYSSSFIHNEPWLAFNAIQTWNRVDLIYPFVTYDYSLTPAKPVVMAEGAYEAGFEYKFDVTPLWIRRQAYYSYLAGGYHSYGHNDSWRVLPTWKNALDSPGAFHMSVLRKIFLSLEEWWNLVPDQTIFASGGKTDGGILNIAARHKDGKWILAYFGSNATFSINMDKIKASKTVKASWINPASGETNAIGKFSNREKQIFTTPEGWEDSLLLLEAA
ncbi:MAG: DUF4038 domain-containing protein [Candidatus Bathyarchaeia archaeon]